ncbi:hypothetical protein H5410_002897 [Solanum commersonii]|uniref:Uncharacterized protein n=1 Tax=Solanum commersonii TaxID=4109 RepID=A0A9J6B3G1_SOLCO|nr:hypothetical protein H5410_002897 [Solanum commersonii]
MRLQLMSRMSKLTMSRLGYRKRTYIEIYQILMGQLCRHCTSEMTLGTDAQIQIDALGTKAHTDGMTTVPSSEGENQTDDIKGKSASRRTVPRCSALSPKVTELEFAEGKCRKAMNQTKWWITEWIGDPD